MSEVVIRNEAVTDDDDLRLAARLEETWGSKPGLVGWLSSTDHKSIGKRYIATCFLFFAFAGILALLMRLQLMKPQNNFLNPDAYAQIFTVHGTAMMFLFAVPVMTAMGVYIVPLMMGTRNISFPRLNAYGYWVFAFGGMFLFVCLLMNSGPEAGWFAYVPLSGPAYSAGKRTDIWAQTVTFTEIAAIVAAIEILVTVFKQRAPGMSINRIPIFAWSMVVVSFMILFAMTTIAIASQVLAADRLIQTHFFNPAEGGDALLWQHLFWYFGHPEVYIMFLPGMGIMSHVITTFSSRDIYGYPAIVLSQIAQGFIGFGLWVHHMFATGLPQLGQSFFTAASLIIAIPSGIQIFCWIATMWAGKPRMATPMLFFFGFLFIFIIGGLSGVMVASVPFDLQVHDTYFIVAHFHYVIIGGVLFPLLSGLYYWFPLFSGRQLNETLGKINFWLLFIGVNVTFFPMHWLGLDGMTRRIYTYMADTGWGKWNKVATIGSWIIAAGVLMLVINIIVTLMSRRKVTHNPWNSGTLEYDVPLPPPSYNFLRIPVVTAREPVWARTPEDAFVTGLRDDHRDILVTTVLDANPDALHEHPGPTLAPLATAIATVITFIILIFNPWGLVIGLVLSIPPLLWWGWPKRAEEELVEEMETA